MKQTVNGRKENEKNIGKWAEKVEQIDEGVENDSIGADRSNAIVSDIRFDDLKWFRLLRGSRKMNEICGDDFVAMDIAVKTILRLVHGTSFVPFIFEMDHFYLKENYPDYDAILTSENPILQDTFYYAIERDEHCRIFFHLKEEFFYDLKEILYYYGVTITDLKTTQFGCQHVVSDPLMDNFHAMATYICRSVTPDTVLIPPYLELTEIPGMTSYNDLFILFAREKYRTLWVIDVDHERPVIKFTKKFLRYMRRYIEDNRV